MENTQLKIVESPEEIRAILRPLFVGKSKDIKISRDQIPVEHLAVLDKQAEEVMQTEGCQVLAVYGCNSCCADGISGSLRKTTCGDFCDKVCGNTPCY